MVLLIVKLLTNIGFLFGTHGINVKRDEVEKILEILSGNIIGNF